MEAGVETAMVLVRRSVCQATWTSYCRVWKEWEVLLSEVGLECGDRLMCLLYWVGRAFSAAVSAAGISRQMSALAFWFKARGEQDWTKSFLVRQAVRGFRKGRTVRDGRRPVSYGLLLRLGSVLNGLCVSEDEIRLFRLAFALAFFGAFRISELVAPSKRQEGGLGFEDVTMLEGRLECILRRSKTDQRGRGTVVVLHALRESSMCPVSCYGAYVEWRREGPGPLLRHLDGTYLSQYQFVQVFRKGLAVLGVDATQFSSHSFRIGAATEAARWGLGPEVVRKIGRWESDRYRL